MKPILRDLSLALVKFHRGLLLFQAELAEKQDGRKYPPYELLNLSLNDPRFMWLRQFSELIIQIDTIVDDKKNTPFDASAINAAVKNLVRLDAEHSHGLLGAIKADSSIMLPLGELRKAMLALETAIASQLQ
ncbi:MAG: hypothetical protein A2622_09300 [Bdellovibrionales bacterium RIFCSPHIGHO2_01_FULL_40_29]|nr:MAG: hypothetical protein A2622_09300 [Bdellovibrionales bacterium RIFCSPHIGHO2_01_FULL_40_29]OFZ33580.1 MAG: hypothetical protein A3D17_00325 [Bdellovibrionales bacterium RIFCSPHIGHO2_02_FULL_40_15]